MGLLLQYHYNCFIPERKFPVFLFILPSKHLQPDYVSSHALSFVWSHMFPSCGTSQPKCLQSIYLSSYWMVLPGRVFYDPSFIHAFKLKCLELWEGRLILPTGRNTCQEQGRHILICFPMEEPPARRLNWWKVQPSRNWNNEIISKSNHPHTPMSIGRIPRFDRGIVSFWSGQNPEWSGLFPMLSGKEMSAG